MDSYFQTLDQRIRNMEQILASIQDAVCSAGAVNRLEEPPPEEVRFNYDELARYLKKDKSTIHRYKKNGAIPYHQVGRTVYFIKFEVDAALSSLTPPKKSKKGESKP